MSREGLTRNMTHMIDFYNRETSRYKEATADAAKETRTDPSKFVASDPSRISWSVNLKVELARGRVLEFEPNSLTRSLYRPFTKQWLYFNRRFNERVLQMPRIFPAIDSINRVFILPGAGEVRGFSVLMADRIPDLHVLHGGQCFPLYLYDTPDASPAKPATQPGLFDAPAAPTTPTRRDAITDVGLAHFAAAYPGETITKEDLFYYIYGLLHSPDYRTRYADNLSKELPRIPAVRSAGDFWHFSKAGRELAHWHLNYETVAPYPATIEVHGMGPLTDADYRVEKMKYGSAGQGGRDKDKTTLHYNARITVKGIPLAAYEYVVNGKPALDWVVERQCVKVDKDSGIVNDANDWAVETMGNPRYPLELFLRVVTVSLETMKVVAGLPGLDA